MRFTAQFQMLLRSLFRRRRLESELDEEFRAHLQQETEENMRLGMAPEQAATRARQLMGSPSLYKEECRDARATRFFEILVRDLRYALRTMRRAPLFTAAAVFTLALAIGANTTVFTFVENILLRPLPVREPAQLVAVNWGKSANISYPNYLDFRDRNAVFSQLAADRVAIVNLSLRNRENFVSWGYEATGNYFQTLGIQPYLGRFFGPAEDDKPNAHPVIVLSYRSWQTHFAADPGAIGRTIKINGYPFTIIGIAPPYFLGTQLLLAGDFWILMSMQLQAEPGEDFLHSRMASNIWPLGHLKPGISRTQAEAELNRIRAALVREHPTELDPKPKIHLGQPGLIGDALRKPIAGFGIVLSILAALGLLLASVNLAGMLLARASDRSREVGIRLALGAGRSQLFRQFLTESALLAVSGGFLGFLLAAAACRAFSAWRFSSEIPLRTELHPNFAVLSFALLITLAATILFGLTSAVHSARADVALTLKEQPGETRSRRWNLRDLLVCGQITLSIALVISSALVVRSLQHALSLNLGFNPDHAVSLSFDLRLKNYSRERSPQFDQALIDKASAIPGIEAAAIINTMPLRVDHADNNIISRADRPVPPPTERRDATVYKISPGYLRAAGTKLLAGRDFDAHDRKGAAATGIVNEALVQALFPNENALGGHVRLSLDPKDKGFEIVGVVETGKYQYLGEDPQPAVFLPIGQTGTDWTTLIARTNLPAQTATELLRKAALDLNPDLSFSNVGSLKDQLALPLFPARAAAIVLGSLGAFAMLLAATGLFALMAYAVSRRTREIGIRMALGAKPQQVLSAVLKRTLIICLVGLTAGTIITLAAARLLSFVLYGISPRDPLTYITALLLMLAVAVAACFHPALRAVHIDPARTLREQ